jgi:predicted GIY-YIG superfamily endonuclease
MPYIYKISNVINNKIYIGKTSQNIKKRFKEHCRDSKRFPNRPLYADMIKYGYSMFKVEEIENCESEELAIKREKFWIEYYQSFYNGYNSTFGGEGKNYCNYDFIYKEWLKDRNCLATAKRIGVSPETVSEAVKVNGEMPYCKKGFADNKLSVDMLDMQNNYIQSFNSVREAAKFIIYEQNKKTSNLGGYSSHISSVCRGNRKTCFGYKWRYSQQKK